MNASVRRRASLTIAAERAGSAHRSPLIPFTCAWSSIVHVPHKPLNETTKRGGMQRCVKLCLPVMHASCERSNSFAGPFRLEERSAIRQLLPPEKVGGHRQEPRGGEGLRRAFVLLSKEEAGGEEAAQTTRDWPSRKRTRREEGAMKQTLGLRVKLRKTVF